MDTQKLLNAPPKQPRIVAKVSKINNLVESSKQIEKSSAKLRKIFETGAYQKKTQLSVLSRYKKRLDGINKESDKRLEKRRNQKGKSIVPKIKPFAGSLFVPKNDPLKSIAQLAAFNAASKLAKGDVFGMVGPGLALASIIFGPKLLKFGAKSALKSVGVGKGYEDLIKKLSKSKNLTKGEEAALKNFDRYRKAGLSVEEAAQRALVRGGGYSVKTAKEYRNLTRTVEGVGERAVERTAGRAAATGTGKAAGGLLKNIRGGVGLLDVAFAGFDFMNRKSEGQTNLQAGAGAADGAIGGIAGWQAGAALGAAIGSLFGGIGAVPGAIIGGLIGSFAGSSLGGGLADMITGANKNSSEGGGLKPFSKSLDKYEKTINKFKLFALTHTSPTTTPTPTTPGSPLVGPIQQVGQYQTNTAANQYYGAPRGGGRQHAGVDLQMYPNSKQITFMGGKVVNIANDPGGYYQYVDIQTPDGTIERLAELATLTPGLKVGSIVQPGQVISTGQGPTGVTHLEYRRPGTTGITGTVNPLDYLKTKGVKVSGSNIKFNAPRTATAPTAVPRQQPNVSQYTSYSPSAYGQGQVVPFPVQTQQPQMIQGGGEMMMLSGPSEQDLLNSFYKRVLLNTV
jgi:murein DD-endopeptidase MepM/ murein hydrolase activator NlpD